MILGERGSWRLRAAAMVMGLLAFTCPPAARAGDETDGAAMAWAALRAGGAVALLRHASAPGTGDPPGFRLDDCATQRNLSAAGRAEAAAIGAAFRARGVHADAVYSSQWCRCLETARLLDLGPVTPFAPLNSFFENQGEEPERTAGVRALLAEPRTGTIVLVTHQVNITALTGILPRSGETVVVRPRESGALDVTGRIPPP